MSVGCVGNHLYTGLADDRVYLMVRGADLEKVAHALDAIMNANAELREFHRIRRPGRPMIAAAGPRFESLTAHHRNQAPAETGVTDLFLRTVQPPAIWGSTKTSLSAPIGSSSASW
jgi:hypothetical protein